MAAIATWRLNLATLSAQGQAGLSTDLVAEDILLSSNAQGQYLSFNYAMNGPGALEFTLPIDKPSHSAYAIGEREVHLYRNDQLVWGGYLVRAEADGVFVRFGCLGWLWRLRKRVITTDLWYQDTDPGEIAWSLVDWAQAQTAGDMGIRRGTVQDTGAVKSTIYCGLNRPVIGDSIEELAELRDGFEYEIAPDKTFNAWSPRRGRDTSLELDAGMHTSLTGVVEDMETIATSMHVLGPSESCTDDNGLILSDAQAVARYGLLEDQVQYDFRDERIRSSKGQAELEMRTRVPVQPKATFQRAGLPGEAAWGEVELGDSVRFTADQGYLSYDIKARVIEQVFDIYPAGVEVWAWQLDGDLTTNRTRAARRASFTALAAIEARPVQFVQAAAALVALGTIASAGRGPQVFAGSAAVNATAAATVSGLISGKWFGAAAINATATVAATGSSADLGLGLQSFGDSPFG